MKVNTQYTTSKRTEVEEMTAEQEHKASEARDAKRQRMIEATLAAGLDPAEFLLAA